MQAECVTHSDQGSVLELPQLERTLLWAIRTWAAYHDVPQAIFGALEQVFADAGIRPAINPFAQLMVNLFSGFKRIPNVFCVRCLKVSRDECELLALMADASLDSQHDLAVRLGRLLLPESARRGAAAVQDMMRIIERAGLRMRQRAPVAEQVGWPPPYMQYMTLRH